VSSHCYVLLQILWLLYDKEIIQEDAILKWDDEKKDAVDFDKVFVKKSEEFIKVSITIHRSPLLVSKGKKESFSCSCIHLCAGLFNFSGIKLKIDESCLS
jgi:hypothetical protein